MNDSLIAFYEATRLLGIAPRVTTYTQTEFNRTLAPNNRHGTDHAWGGHELVIGGSVRGGDLYGRFPSLALGGPDDLDSRGVWIPSTSEVQYLSTFATWFGVRHIEELPEFENLRNFPQPVLGLLAE